jgi:hypothetical protein
MTRITNVEILIDDTTGECILKLPSGDVCCYHPGMTVKSMAVDLASMSRQYTSRRAQGASAYGGNVYHHAGNQPANHSAIKGIPQQPGSGVGYDPTVGQIHPPASPASEPPPAPCGWCGFTMGHAPNCLFVPRDQQG